MLKKFSEKIGFVAATMLKLDSRAMADNSAKSVQQPAQQLTTAFLVAMDVYVRRTSRNAGIVSKCQQLFASIVERRSCLE